MYRVMCSTGKIRPMAFMFDKCRCLWRMCVDCCAEVLHLTTR